MEYASDLDKAWRQSTRRGEPSSPTLRRTRIQVLQEARETWSLGLPLRWGPSGPSRETRWYDAETGVELLRRQHVLHAFARAFPENPVVTPDIVTFPIPLIEGDELEEASLSVWGCGAQPLLPSPWTADAQRCFPQRYARGVDGDFMFEPFLGDRSPAAFTDPFAEVSAYVHARIFIDVLGARGFFVSPCDTTQILTNYSAVGPDDELAPIDTAFYTGVCGTEGPTVVLGQGVRVDYAYDADVVYHELGHAVIDGTSPNGLWRLSCDEHSCSQDALAINEALADYQAAMVSGNPEIGEFVGEYLGRVDGFRNLSQPFICPQDMSGDIYNDSQILSSALWKIRGEVGEGFDDVVFGALAEVPENIRFGAFGALLLEIAEQRDIDDGDLTTMAYRLEEAGLLGCGRIRSAHEGLAFWVWPREPLVDGGQPGPLQLRFDAVPESRRIAAEFSLRSLVQAGAPGLEPVDLEVEWLGGLARPVVFSPTIDTDRRVRYQVRDPALAVIDFAPVSGSVWRVEMDVPGGQTAYLAITNGHADRSIEVRLLEVKSTLYEGVMGCQAAPGAGGGIEWICLGYILMLLRRRWA